MILCFYLVVTGRIKGLLDPPDIQRPDSQLGGRKLQWTSHFLTNLLYEVLWICTQLWSRAKMTVDTDKLVRWFVQTPPSKNRQFHNWLICFCYYSKWCALSGGVCTPVFLSLQLSLSRVNLWHIYLLLLTVGVVEEAAPDFEQTTVLILFGNEISVKNTNKILFQNMNCIQKSLHFLNTSNSVTRNFL